MMAKYYRSGDGPFLKIKITPKFSIYFENLHYFQIYNIKCLTKICDFFVTKSPQESIYIFQFSGKLHQIPLFLTVTTKRQGWWSNNSVEILKITFEISKISVEISRNFKHFGRNLNQSKSLAFRLKLRTFLSKYEKIRSKSKIF